MYNLKGFIPHADFAINVPGQNAAIGELSVKSLTYSKEVGFYNDDTLPSVNLVAFTSNRDGVKIQAPDVAKSQTLKIANWIYNNTIQHPGQVFPDILLQSLITQFAAEANNFACGAIVNQDPYWMPEWVSWTSTTLGEANAVRVWFNDASFQSHYDEFEIVVVPPIDHLDDFFKTSSEVRALLAALTIPQIIDKAQQAKNGFPETVIRCESFNYVPPLPDTVLALSHWGLLIYGAAGDNIDSIKDALVSYILANSTHTRDDWIKVLPDLFRRTEITIVPLWDQYALASRTSVDGIYSPQANLTRAMQVIKSYTASYASDTHINTYASIMGNPYKSLALVSVGSPENRNQLFALEDIFPDLIMVSSTSPDFIRMSQATQQWLLYLAVMLLAAENMTPFSDLPEGGYGRVTRNNQLFIVKTVDNIQYLVAAKFNFLPPVNPGT